ncbi:MAG: MerR family transcriptional regulator [Clostridia bacterium]|nr:MerR family transcriptional regulator [Clostridia bacterium]
MKTVKEVAEQTGISVRTLHYYDEIGLFKPTKVTEAGYRLYDDEALDRLGQILVFRELDLPLADIKLIMENPTLDRGILEKQREMLLIKMDRIGHIITNLDQMLKGEQKMDFSWFDYGSQWDMYKSMVEGMDDAQKQSFIDYYGSMEEWEKHMREGFDGEQARKYYAQAGNWYGGMDSMKEIWKEMPKPDEYVALQKKVGEVQRNLANLMGTDAASDEAKKLIEESEGIVKELYRVDSSKEILLDIAKRYQKDGDMHETVDYMYGEGAADYIALAIKSFYKEN